MNASSRWRGWLAALLIFFVGAAAGTAATVFIGVRILRKNLRAPAASMAFIDRALDRTYSSIEDELDLTPAQAARMQSEFRLLAEKIKRVRLESSERYSAEVSLAASRIAADLPPEKQAAFQQLVENRFPRVTITPAPSASK